MIGYHHVVLPAVPWGPHNADEQRLGLSAGYPRMVYSPASLLAHWELNMTVMGMKSIQLGSREEWF